MEPGLSSPFWEWEEIDISNSSSSSIVCITDEWLSHMFSEAMEHDSALDTYVASVVYYASLSIVLIRTKKTR